MHAQRRPDEGPADYSDADGQSREHDYPKQEKKRQTNTLRNGHVVLPPGRRTVRSEISLVRILDRPQMIGKKIMNTMSHFRSLHV